MRLGIDFGTTRTVVAACDRGNTPVVSFEDVDGTLRDHIPTLAATDGAALRFGWQAVAALREPGVVGLRSFKRLLSGPDAGPRQEVVFGGRAWSVASLVEGFLAHLREQLVHHSNAPSGAEGPIEAMVAVPAGASSAQRFVTLAAFRAAGFDVRGLLNEPSAAGVEYAHRYSKSLTKARQEVLVYDLGGGTFDASRVSMADGAHAVVGHVGLNRLGGHDFDAILLDLALAAAGRPRPSDPTALLEHCREQKEGITPNTRKVLVEIDADSTVQIAAADYFAACAPLIQRTLDAVGPLGSADDPALAGVYVVGGASDLPVVARMLKERFGAKVKRSAYSSASIAVGLALALDGQGPALTDTLSRTFGVFREAGGGEDIVFDAILTPDRPLDGAALVRRYRAVHNVGHFRFVECDHLTDGAPDGDVTPFAELRFPYDSALADADLGGVAVERLGAGPVVEERYAVDAAGLVHVRITNLDTGYTVERALG